MSQQAIWRGLLEGFSQLVSDFIIFYFLQNMKANFFKKLSAKIIWFWKPSKKLFISWRNPFKGWYLGLLAGVMGEDDEVDEGLRVVGILLHGLLQRLLRLSILTLATQQFLDNHKKWRSATHFNIRLLPYVKWDPYSKTDNPPPSLSKYLIYTNIFTKI